MPPARLGLVHDTRESAADTAKDASYRETFADSVGTSLCCSLGVPRRMAKIRAERACSMPPPVESTRKMTRFKNYSRLTIFCFWLVGGCSSLSGTWRAVDTDPPNAAGVFRTITFDGPRYTATADEGAKRRTTTGDFHWSGSKLTLRMAEGTARVFVGRKSDGRLTLVDERPSGQVRTTFQKIAD